MTNLYFPAIIERGAEGFGVFFPDLPGCVSAGATLQATARHAEEALFLHLSGMAEDGEPVPTPSDMDAIARDPEIDEVCRILVRAELPGRKVRVNIMMDEDVLAAIERVADNRSQFLNDAARAALAARRAA